MGLTRVDYWRLAAATLLVLATSGFIFATLSQRAMAFGWPSEWIVSVLTSGWTFPSVAAACALGVGTLFVGFIFAQRPRADHGTARFGTEKDLKRAGLRAASGILLGQQGDRFVVAGGQDHVGLFAPTRGGKGVSVVVPNLLTWQASAVVFDTKQENFRITSGYRAAHGSEVYLFNPSSLETHRFNYLDAVRRDPVHRVGDLQMIAALLYPDPERGEKHWAENARELFLGLGLLLLDNYAALGTVYAGVQPGDVSLAAVRRLATQEKPLAEVFEGWLKIDRGAPRRLDPECRRILGSMAVKPYKEFGSIVSTLAAGLALFANQVISSATASSDFDLLDLRRGGEFGKPITVYVNVPPGEIKRLAKLVNLFFQLVTNVLTRDMPRPGEHQVLLLMDEFAALGRMGSLKSAIPVIAGYQVRFLAILQSVSQLREIYGPDGANAIMENLRYRLIMTPNSVATAEEVSKMLGVYGARQRSRSRQGDKVHASATDSLMRRNLLNPDELLRLPADQLLVLVEGHRPLRIEKARYYEHRFFVGKWNHWEYDSDGPSSIEVEEIQLRKEPEVKTIEEYVSEQSREIEEAAVEAANEIGDLMDALAAT